VNRRPASRYYREESSNAKTIHLPVPPLARVRQSAEPPVFDVASIKPSDRSAQHVIGSGPEDSLMPVASP